MSGFDVYIRVSRKGDREGESYITIPEQRKKCESVAHRKGIELSGFEVVEEDVSGAKKASERGLENILRRIESGESAGLIVAFQDRLSRGSLREQAEIWDRLEKANARLITDDGLDSADPGQELLFAIRAAIARDGWKRRQENWASARRNAVERGIHISSTVPIGYLYSKTGLVVDPKLAPVVVELFEHRARGWNWTKLAKWLNGQPGTPGTANRETIRHIITSQVYRGVAWSGAYSKRNAHEAIVTQMLWDEANRDELRGQTKRGDGSMAGSMLCLGVVRCANCGSLLSASGSRRKIETGFERVPAYTCKNFHCTEKAWITAKRLDSYIRTWIITIPNTAGLIVHEATDKTLEAKTKFDAAEYDRKLLISNRKLRRLIPPEEYAAELEALNEAVAVAEHELRLAEREKISTSIHTIIELWPTLTMDERRNYLHKILDKFTVKAAKRKKLATVDQVQIELVGALTPKLDLLNPVDD